MTAPVCDWPVVYPGDCPALDTVSDPLVFEAMAIAFLWNWTGRGYGVCPVALRPCRSDCAQADSTFWGYGPYTSGSAMPAKARWGPALVGGQWFNLSCGACGDDCSCSSTGAPSLRLPGPIDSVQEVLIGGDRLLPNAYRVDNRSLLVRTDGGAWPTCQDMAAAPDKPGTFQISYLYGTPVPLGGQVAAGVLACELAKASSGDRSCQLPTRIQTLTRQGVTMTMLDTFEDVEKGRTGLWLVDSWVASVTQPRRGGKVRSVDIPSPRNRVQTWP